jgi:hypothetical protein
MAHRSTRPRRIVHVGNFGYKATKLFLHGVASKLTNGWVRAGHHVINFSDRDIARWVGPLGNRRWGVKPANQILLDLCIANQPDLVALGHADIISPQTLAKIREALPEVKIVQWNVDPVFDGADASSDDNTARIKSKQAVVDATFISTAGRWLKPFAEGGHTVAFLPNPVDASLERGRNFERTDLPNDVFLAVHYGHQPRFHAGRWQATDDLARELAAALPDLSFSTHGINGAPFVSGPAYEAAMTACAQGVNLSRRNDAYLYSSDRLSHLAGNGLAVHIDRATGYEDLFGPDQFAFYSTQDELAENLGHLAREPAARQALAEAGWRRYFDLFNSTLLAQYMLDVAMGEHDPAGFEWPTVFRGSASRGVGG